MVVYFEDWTIYFMLKEHYKWLRLMLEHCGQIHLSLNIKNLCFAASIGILLGHIVCKEGIKVNFSKNKIILDLKPPVNPKQVRISLGHKGYYRKFIRNYSYMTYLSEKLLKENQGYEWTIECDISFDILKKKLVEAPIL